MDSSDQGKLFVGGISWETTEEKLHEYFGQYGEVSQAVVMRDKITGKPRGFGFVAFADPSTVDRVLQDQHTIDGRTVEAKRALSREEQQNSARSGSFSEKNMNNGGGFRTKKIFVGGLPPTLTEEGFRQYFEAYGYVIDVTVMYDQTTQRPRGFGFVTFDSEEAVDRVLHKTFHDLDGKQVEVKRALPKDANPGGGSRSMGSGSGAGGYQGYGASGGNPNTYAGRTDSSRYMQPQNTGSYPQYGPSGFATPGYGYGAASNGMGYGGYGSYGAGSTAYGGQTGAAFGNPNVPNTSGASRNSWNSQNPSAYGTMGYGNTGWGGPQGGAGGGRPGSATAVQIPSGAAGYGNQNYGYGGFGGHPGSAPNSVGGGPGGEFPGSGSGYMGSGYGEVNEQPGYGNEAWKSDPSQAAGNYGAAQAGGQGNYVSGYGAQARQMQQH